MNLKQKNAEDSKKEDKQESKQESKQEGKKEEGREDKNLKSRGLEEILKEQGKLVLTAEGNSMLPMYPPEKGRIDLRTCKRRGLSSSSNLVSKRERRLCIAQSDGKFGS